MCKHALLTRRAPRVARKQEDFFSRLCVSGGEFDLPSARSVAWRTTGLAAVCARHLVADTRRESSFTAGLQQLHDAVLLCLSCCVSVAELGEPRRKE